MKAAAFDYVRPDNLAMTLELVASHGDDARIIAGGQSLVPMMAMRLVRPNVLVDIGRLEALRGVAEHDDAITVGAVTSQTDAGRAGPVQRHVPLLAAALPYVGHVQTRNRGTVGGSLAHADPTAEIILAAVALGAELTLTSLRGARNLAIKDFVAGPMETAAAEDECLTAIRFPKPPAGCRIGVSVEEVSPRAGDYAVVAVAAEIGLDASGICRHARLAAAGASPVAVRAAATEAALTGTALDAAAISEAVTLLDPLLDPQTDLQATARYRRRVAPRLLARAIATAQDRASKAAS